MAMRRTFYHGHLLNQRTVDMLKRAEKRLGRNLVVLQGSYHSGVSASAGTHDGGGAVDVSPTSNPREVVKQLRASGFAAWHRLPSQGPWVEHIHAIAIKDAELSSGARFQVSEYYAGRNGLANRGPDPGPKVHPIRTWYIALSKVRLHVVVNQFTTKKPEERYAVKCVQTMLNYRLKKNLLVDGVAGPKTRAAYKDWQRHINPKWVTGVPGPKNLSALIAGWYRMVL